MAQFLFFNHVQQTLTQKRIYFNIIFIHFYHLNIFKKSLLFNTLHISLKISVNAWCFLEFEMSSAKKWAYKTEIRQEC